MYTHRLKAPLEAAKNSQAHDPSRPNGDAQDPKRLRPKRSEDRVPEEKRSLMDALESSAHFKLFTDALKQAHLEDRLRHFSGPYTVLAPTDAALRALPSLPDDPQGFVPILNRHIVFGRLEAKDLWRRARLAPLGGKSIRIDRKARKIENAHVVIQNLTAGNGIVHGISSVLCHDVSGRQEAMENLTLLKIALLYPIKAMLK